MAAPTAEAEAEEAESGERKGQWRAMSSRAATVGALAPEFKNGQRSLPEEEAADASVLRSWACMISDGCFACVASFGV
jgi:hypothetical protein